jgi:hypothetical protein
MRNSLIKFLLISLCLSICLCHGGKNQNSRHQQQEQDPANGMTRSGIRPNWEGHMRGSGIPPRNGSGKHPGKGSWKHPGKGSWKHPRDGSDMTHIRGHGQPRGNRHDNSEIDGNLKNREIDFSAESRHEEERSRHKKHHKGVLKKVGKIFTFIMILAFIILFIIGVVYGGVKVFNRIMRLRRERRCERGLTRGRQAHLPEIHWQCSSHHCHGQGQAAVNPNPNINENSNNQISAALTNLPPRNPNCVNNINNVNSINDYELLNNSTTNREVSELRPEFHYPKLDQVTSTAHCDFQRRSTSNSNTRGQEFNEAPQIKNPLLK